MPSQSDDAADEAGNPPGRRARFGVVPIAAALDPAIGRSATALRVLVLMCGHATKTGSCFPKQASMAAQLGVDKSKISKAIRLLEEREAITRVQRTPRGILYRINRDMPVIEIDDEDEGADAVAADADLENETASRVALHVNSQADSELPSTSTHFGVYELPHTSTQAACELPSASTHIDLSELPCTSTVSCPVGQLYITDQLTDQGSTPYNPPLGDSDAIAGETVHTAEPIEITALVEFPKQPRPRLPAGSTKADRERYLGERFDGEFWPNFPRTRRSIDGKDRDDCRRRFTSLVIADGVDPDEIIEGVLRYAASEDATKDNGRFACAPSVFLNQRRWQREFPPAGSSTGFSGRAARPGALDALVRTMRGSP